MIQFTSSAADKIQSIIAQQDSPACFRIKIQGGGCNGFEYNFGLDTHANDQDFSQTIPASCGKTFAFIIDPISNQYLIGSTIDFKVSASGEQFEINNPNANTVCSCGSSFSTTGEKS